MSRVEANSERGAASNRWLAKQTEWRCTAVCGRWYNPGGSITRSGDSNQTVEIVSWRQTRERVKRGGWADGVTLFAAEEDSDIISSQLLSTFPSRAVLYLLSFLIETRTAAARAAARLLGLCLWEKLFFSCSPLLFPFFSSSSFLYLLAGSIAWSSVWKLLLSACVFPSHVGSALVNNPFLEERDRRERELGGHHSLSLAFSHSLSLIDLDVCKTAKWREFPALSLAPF